MTEHVVTSRGGATEQYTKDMPPAAEAIAAAVPRGASRAVAGTQHTWEPEGMADELVRFVRATQP